MDDFIVYNLDLIKENEKLMESINNELMSINQLILQLNTGSDVDLMIYNTNHINSAKSPLLEQLNSFLLMNNQLYKQIVEWMIEEKTLDTQNKKRDK